MSPPHVALFPYSFLSLFFPICPLLALSLSQTSLADKHDKLSGVAAEARGAGQAALKGAGGLHTVLSVHLVEYYC